MDNSMSQELKALAEQLSADDFRCLSKGIGILTRPKKTGQVPMAAKSQASKNSEPKAKPNERKIRQINDLKMRKATLRKRAKRKAADKVAATHDPENAQLELKAWYSIPMKIFTWVCKKCLAWFLDANFALISVFMVIFSYSLTKGVFDENQEQWLLSLVDRVLEFESHSILALGFFILLIMYGMLFRLIVGATLGEAIISRFFVSAKSKKNKRLYNNFT